MDGDGRGDNVCGGIQDAGEWRAHSDWTAGGRHEGVRTDCTQLGAV